jgi:uncharacterized protein with HEPN domain
MLKKYKSTKLQQISEIIYPGIEGTRIRGFINRIVDDYFWIDYEIVWDIIETYRNELIEWSDKLIKLSKI